MRPRQEDISSTILDALKAWIVQTARENVYLLVIAVYTAVQAILRATGVTVKSGTTGLLFSFGHAKKEIPPGFRVLIPFLQVVRTVPTRQRTMDLPSQRVTTLDGLVYYVDSNLVYRVADVRKALIAIDDLVQGMRQVLVTSVQEVIRESERTVFRASDELNRRLGEAMAQRTDAWGVRIESAGFTSITPSPKTLRLTQLGERVAARRGVLAQLEERVPRSMGLPLLGTNQRMLTRAEVGREREVARRRRRRVERLFRRASRTLAELRLDPRTRRKLRAELLSDAGLAGVLGDAGTGDDPPRGRDEQEDEKQKDRSRARRERGAREGRADRGGNARPSFRTRTRATANPTRN